MSVSSLRSEGEWGSLAVPSVLAAAHELKAPLTLVRQLALQLEQTGNLSSEQQLVQERIRLTAERALRLVDNLTKASRLEDALFALEPLHAHSIWGDVVHELSPLAHGLEQTIELAVPRKPLLVVAHRELLPAILTGLCDNALSHNPAGSSVHVGARQSGGSIVFSVRDSGPAVEHKVFRSLSERLGTMPQPLGARPNSSGLGLWVAGSFARAMNSHLRATRHRQGGMTFSLHVPVSSQLSLL